MYFKRDVYLRLFNLSGFFFAKVCKVLIKIFRKQRINGVQKNNIVTTNTPHTHTNENHTDTYRLASFK